MSTIEVILTISTALLAGLSLWLYLRKSIAQAELNLYKQQEPARLDLLRKEWEALSYRLVQEGSQNLQTQGEKGLKDLLSPLQQELLRLQKQMHEQTRIESMREERLIQTMQNMQVLNQQLAKQAENLSHALRGDQKLVGDYGEVLLQRLLEFAGLKCPEHYVLQGEGLGLKSEDGGHLKPDVIVLFPEQRCLVIDAKMSLTAWTDAQTADSSIREKALQRMLVSVRNHIQDLSQKAYPASLAKTNLQSLDFVFLFIPIEGVFHTCLQLDQDLYRHAFSKKIILVSPTTLLASLTTIQQTWKQYEIGKNAQEISDRAGKLLDKFRDYMSAMDDIGKHLRKADDAYLLAQKRLSEGNGNLIRQAEKLHELGAEGRGPNI